MLRMRNSPFGVGDALVPTEHGVASKTSSPWVTYTRCADVLMWTFTAPVGFLTEGSKENALRGPVVGMEQELNTRAIAAVAMTEDSLVKRFIVVRMRHIFPINGEQATRKALRTIFGKDRNFHFPTTFSERVGIPP